MKISVVIPVYNRIKFIETAIESAHSNVEVVEVIVVDDGSTDGTYELLVAIRNNYTKLLLLNHPGRINKGISATRNLGIVNASSEWISFLDSDDYFLPNRYVETSKVIRLFPEIDGVYEPIVNQIISDEGSNRFVASGSNVLDGSIIGLNCEVAPEQLFEALYYGKAGFFSIVGLTVRKQLALDVAMFDEGLRIGEDVLFRLKVAYRGKLFPGKKTPVAVRIIHDQNSEPSGISFDKFRRYELLLEYLLLWNAKKVLIRNVIRRLLYYYSVLKNSRKLSIRIAWYCKYLLEHPKLLYCYFW